MSYRVHINICKRIDFEDYLKLHRDDPEEYSMYLPEIKGNICSEICDEFPRSHFSEIDGCDSYILNKENFLELLKFYQDLQLKIAKERIDRIEKIYKLYNKKDGYRKAERELFKLLFSSKGEADNKECYYNILKRDNELITDSDTFSIQYFYLVKLYESFNDDTDVLVITHG